MSRYGYRYRCSICAELVEPDGLALHLQAERDKPTWPGVLEWERVDDEDGGDPDGFDEAVNG